MEPLGVSEGSLWTQNCPGASLGLLCRDEWGWSSSNISHEARIRGCKRRTVYFHPNWSNGTVSINRINIIHS